MSTEPNKSSTSEPRVSLSGFQAWVKMTFKPSPATIEEVINDPNASSIRAFLLIYIPSLIIWWDWLFNAQASGEFGTELTYICIAPILALLPLFAVLIYISATSYIAKGLGGVGRRFDLYYANAYIFPAYALIGLSLTFFFGYPAISIAGIYFILINFGIVKTVEKLGWLKAIFSSVIGLLILGLSVFLLFNVTLFLLGG